MRNVLLIVITLFIVICVFDPADLLFHLKVPLFCLCWFILLFYIMNYKVNCQIPVGLGTYTFLMIFIPLVSILYYNFTNGSQPYEGYQLFKAYVLISFAILLYLARIDILKPFSAILTILSLAIICVYVVVTFEPSLYIPIKKFGDDSGLIIMDYREYSSNLRMLQAFFVTSPMLIFSISHYVYSAINANKIKRLIYSLLATINVVAMFLAGTRNNLAVSICLPITLIVMYSKKRKLTALLFTICFVFLAICYSDAIQTLLNPKEFSNAIKLGFLSDYFNIFNDPKNLLTGQGLGSYYFWNARGYENYITELTYFEIIRNHGIFMGMLLLLMLLYPIIYAFHYNTSFHLKHIVVGYAFYLIMCMTNPLMFSSLGMLILSVLIADIFIYKDERPNMIHRGRNRALPGNWPCFRFMR